MLQEGSIQYINEITYLGSMINSRGSIKYDIQLEINSNKKKSNKFYAFINKDFTAPINNSERNSIGVMFTHSNIIQLRSMGRC